MPTRGQVHTIFARRLDELAAQADAKADAARGRGRRAWGGPDDWSGGPCDIPGLVAPYDRSEIDQNYADLLSSGDSPGTVGDVVAVKTQADYLALQERGIRTRYASSIRCIGHASARWRGHGSRKGVFHDGLVRYVQDCIKAGGGR
jgi:hypothetical protein